MFNKNNFNLDSEEVILKTSSELLGDGEKVGDINDLFQAISKSDGTIRTVTAI